MIGSSAISVINDVEPQPRLPAVIPEVSACHCCRDEGIPLSSNPTLRARREGWNGEGSCCRVHGGLVCVCVCRWRSPCAICTASTRARNTWNNNNNNNSNCSAREQSARAQKHAKGITEQMRSRIHERARTNTQTRWLIIATGFKQNTLPHCLFCVERRDVSRAAPEGVGRGRSALSAGCKSAHENLAGRAHARTSVSPRRCAEMDLFQRPRRDLKV